LVRHDHPHELFAALVRTLAKAGFTPVSGGCVRFENDGKIGSFLPSPTDPKRASAEPAFAAFVELMLGTHEG
jgi:hypothetical protein